MAFVVRSDDDACPDNPEKSRRRVARSAPASEDARPFPSEAPEGDAPARGPLSPFSLLWIKSLEEKERLPLEVSAQTPPAAIFRAFARHAAGGGCRATAQADLLHLRLRTHAYLSASPSARPLSARTSNAPDAVGFGRRYIRAQKFWQPPSLETATISKQISTTRTSRRSAVAAFDSLTSPEIECVSNGVWRQLGWERYAARHTLMRGESLAPRPESFPATSCFIDRAAQAGGGYSLAGCPSLSGSGLHKR